MRISINCKVGFGTSFEWKDDVLLKQRKDKKKSKTEQTHTHVKKT